MAQIYAIYLRSNPVVYDVLLTRATAEVDFQQFFDPEPGSYVDHRKRANPKLYANMNDVDFLVLESSPFWPKNDYKDSLMRWDLQPTHVLGAIRAALGLEDVDEESAVSSTPSAASRAELLENRFFTQDMQPSEINDRDVEVEIRAAELWECPKDRSPHAVWTTEELAARGQGDGSSHFIYYLTEEELIELREIYKYMFARTGQNPDHPCVHRVTGLLAFHEQLRLQEGKS